jgi:hypothetical protein
LIRRLAVAPLLADLLNAQIAQRRVQKGVAWPRASRHKRLSNGCKRLHSRPPFRAIRKRKRAFIEKAQDYFVSFFHCKWLEIEFVTSIFALTGVLPTARTKKILSEATIIKQRDVNE